MDLVLGKSKQYWQARESVSDPSDSPSQPQNPQPFSETLNPSQPSLPVPTSQINSTPVGTSKDPPKAISQITSKPVSDTNKTIITTIDTSNQFSSLTNPPNADPTWDPWEQAVADQNTSEGVESPELVVNDQSRNPENELLLNRGTTKDC